MKKLCNVGSKGELLAGACGEYDGAMRTLKYATEKMYNMAFNDEDLKDLQEWEELMKRRATDRLAKKIAIIMGMYEE